MYFSYNYLHNPTRLVYEHLPTYIKPWMVNPIQTHTARHVRTDHRSHTETEQRRKFRRSNGARPPAMMAPQARSEVAKGWLWQWIARWECPTKVAEQVSELQRMCKTAMVYNV